MELSVFNNISMNGRMAYLIMCVENYLISRYPDKDWSVLAQKMWWATSTYWDDWDYEFMEIIPEYLFSKNDYISCGFDALSEEDYDYYTNLFRNMPDDFNRLLLNLHKLQEVYCYSSIPSYGKEAVEIVFDSVSILEKSNIVIPDSKLISFSSFSEKDGWGDFFDGTKLSRLIK